MSLMSNAVTVKKGVSVVRSELDYGDHAPVTELEGVRLDSIYEAKCLPYLQPGDLLWCVGIRNAERVEAGASVAPGEHSPVEVRGDYFLKREDLVSVGGGYGGKVRACWRIANSAPKLEGLVTAGSRHSPQLAIVARIGALLGVPTVGHTSYGELGEELLDAEEQGMELVRHRPGYNTVIIARAREDADKRGWTHVPFGMDSAVAVKETARQVESLVGLDFKRIVVPVGSGITFSGILKGRKDFGLEQPVLGVQVGADWRKTVKKYAYYL